MRAHVIIVSGLVLSVVGACNRPNDTAPLGERQRQAEEWNSKSDRDSHDRVSDGMPRRDPSPSEPRRVHKLKDGDIDDIDVGRTLTASGEIGDKTRHFKAGEPVFVAVDTEHIDVDSTVTAVLRLKDGQVLAQKTATITGTDPRFHIEKTDGLPVGDYTVEIRLGSGNTMEQSFQVR